MGRGVYEGEGWGGQEGWGVEGVKVEERRSRNDVGERRRRRGRGVGHGVEGLGESRKGDEGEEGGEGEWRF